MFITPIESPWSELSNGILVDVWVWTLTPNQLFSPPDPAIASSISFCYALHNNSQPHQPTPPGTETIPSISSWFELSVGMVSAPGVVGWWCCVWGHNTMPDRLQKGWIGGGYFHLLQAPFGTAVAKKHRSCAPSWSGVAAGAAQVPNWLLPLQQWRRCQCDASMMHQTLNSLINTINDITFSFNYITLLLMMSADCCMPRRREWCTMEAVGRQRGGVFFYLALT